MEETNSSQVSHLKRKLVDDHGNLEACDSNSLTKQQRYDGVFESTTNDGTDLAPKSFEKQTEIQQDLKCDNGTIKQDEDSSPGKQNQGSVSETNTQFEEMDNSAQEGPKESQISFPVEAVADSQGIQQPLPDPLSYTKGGEFTSEIYKIQLHNMPRFGFQQLKKRMISLGLKPHKLKSPNQNVTYICFKNEADKNEALQKLNGYVWKGKKLEAKEAAPIADPFLKKRQEATDSGSSHVEKELPIQKQLTPEEAQERLRSNVVPLWNVEYSKQLEMKTEKIKQVLFKISRNPSLKDQFMQREGWSPGDKVCTLLPIIASPITSDYRNKNEFTIGYDLDGKTIKVGFRFGLYKDGTTAVGEPGNLGNVMPIALPVVESFRSFLTKSKWSPFLQQTSTGHWHTLTVRSFLSGDVMAMVDFDPRKLDKTEVEAAKTSVKEFYTVGEGKEINITSFYFRIVGKQPNSLNGAQRLEHIFGDPHVHESLLGLKFRISPEAFFQVNTQAAECLYKLIGEWCEVTPTTTVLDICCGTGTVGLSMAKRAKAMIGIEMCKPAVEDAKVNATLNGITNATFHCAKVEDVIGRVVSSLRSSSSSPSSSPSTSPHSTSTQNDIVAVVDPPRAGVHKNVIKILRKCEEIQRLVYVSCNAQSAMDNFIDLIRPGSKRHPGQAFTLVKAVPVDLFPGTLHCELVLFFTR